MLRLFSYIHRDVRRALAFEAFQCLGMKVILLFTRLKADLNALHACSAHYPLGYSIMSYTDRPVLESARLNGAGPSSSKHCEAALNIMRLPH